MQKNLYSTCTFSLLNLTSIIKTTISANNKSSSRYVQTAKQPPCKNIECLIYLFTLCTNADLWKENNLKIMESATKFVQDSLLIPAGRSDCPWQWGWWSSPWPCRRRRAAPPAWCGPPWERGAQRASLPWWRWPCRRRYPGPSCWRWPPGHCCGCPLQA